MILCTHQGRSYFRRDQSELTSLRRLRLVEEAVANISEEGWKAMLAIGEVMCSSDLIGSGRSGCSALVVRRLEDE